MGNKSRFTFAPKLRRKLPPMILSSEKQEDMSTTLNKYCGYALEHTNSDWRRRKALIHV